MTEGQLVRQGVLPITGMRVPRARGERGWGGPARHRGQAPLSLVSLPSPPVPKWHISSSRSKPSPSGNSGQ